MHSLISESSKSTALIVVRDVNASSGGLGVSVPSLAAHLDALTSWNVRLAVNGRIGSDGSVLFPAQGVDSWRRFSWRDCGVAHVNGLWDPFLHSALRGARKRGIPTVVSVRGMLEPWALQHKALKKRLAWWLYQRRDLVGAAVLHSTSDAETDSIRGQGLTNPICRIPNGVDVPERDRCGGPRQQVVRFLGRLHPIKGLDLLLRAWAAVDRSDWLLDIVGPDEDGYRRVLEALVCELGLARSVTFSGALRGDAKWSALGEAGVVVLPSHSENFGLAAAEALAAGTPVIASRGTPWSGLVEHGCGWWVPARPDAFAAALKKAMSTGLEGLDTMGEQGRNYVSSSFSWRQVAEQMRDVYDWIAKRGPKPSSISESDSEP
jgi:glycosyltransferase involved in cell wall biosynthesis